MWINRQEPIKVGYHPVKFSGHRHSDNLKYSDFNLSRDLANPRDERVIWLYKQEPIKVSYHPGKCGGNKHFGSDITF